MKKKTIVGLIAIIALVSVVMFVGCIEEDKAVDKAVVGEPSDYFPTSTGMKWVYQIEIGEVEPLKYKVTSWPQGDSEVTYGTKERFLVLTEKKPPKTFLLEIQVKGPAAKQGPVLEYKNGVELDIEKDELGIFDEAKQVFWAMSPGGPFRVFEIVTYSPDTIGAPTSSWGSWGQEDGYSMALLFFGEKPGISIGMAESPDTLLFVGVDTQVPQYEGTPLLHFRRIVESSEKEKGEEHGYLDKGFTEDRWFARGKGLVRLEQKVEEETSMIWTLIQFSR